MTFDPAVIAQASFLLFSQWLTWQRQTYQLLLEDAPTVNVDEFWQAQHALLMQQALLVAHLLQDDMKSAAETPARE